MRRRRPLRSQLGAAASSGGCALLRGMFRAAHSIVLLGSPLLLLTMALAAVAAVASAVVAPPAWVVAIGYSNSTSAHCAHKSCNCQTRCQMYSKARNQRIQRKEAKSRNSR